MTSADYSKFMPDRYTDHMPAPTPTWWEWNGNTVHVARAVVPDAPIRVLGIHGAGGLVGALLTGVFASTAINSLSEGANVMTQLLGLGWVIAWSAGGTFVILLICKYTTGLRVSEAGEDEGLDTHLHGEALESV